VGVKVSEATMNGHMSKIRSLERWSCLNYHSERPRNTDGLYKMTAGECVRRPQPQLGSSGVKYLAQVDMDGVPVKTAHLNIPHAVLCSFSYPSLCSHRLAAWDSFQPSGDGQDHQGKKARSFFIFRTLMRF
jgi:hypothetical protein